MNPDDGDESGFRCSECERLLTNEQMTRGIGMCGGCEADSEEPPDWRY